MMTFRRRQGRGPTLVCHHGSADNHHVYDRLLGALPDRGSIAVNAPGRAGTDGPPLSSVAEMESHLARFVDSEVEGDYVVVGHSLGGGVAIEHALTSAPNRLQGVVLLATGARLRVHPMILQLFEQISKTGKLPPLPPSVFEPGVDPALTKEASTYRELTPIETGGADWRAANAFDRMQDLGRIEVPALIIAGTEDALTPPKYAEYMHAHIPQSELWVIEGAGHMFLMERANEIAKAIDRFITEHRL
jgi:pimeloyl-ACP methyl ester carboxylesterase